MKFNIRILAVVALLAFAAGALVIAACGDDADDSGASAQVEQSDFDALKEQATRSAILAAYTVTRVEQLHDLEESISAASEIDDGWEGRATRMRRATASVDWPEDMKEQAETALTALTNLEEALADGNLDDAKTYATESHDPWHELEHDALPYVAGEEHEEESDGQSEGEESPEASGH